MAVVWCKYVSHSIDISSKLFHFEVRRIIFKRDSGSSNVKDLILVCAATKIEEPDRVTGPAQ